MTLDRDRALAIVDAALEASDADETEVIVGGGRMALTRFAANHVHQHVDEDRLVVRVRGAWTVGGATRVAAASTERLDADGLREVIDRARSLAEHADPLDDWRGMAVPEFFASSRPPDGEPWDATTADTGPAWRVNEVARCILPCRRAGDLTASGLLRITDGTLGDYGDPGIVAIGNTHGIRQHHRPTTVDMMCTVTTDSGASGWVTAWANRRSAIDMDALAQRAIERARAAESPRTVDAGSARVLLEPPAVAALLGFALPGFSRRAVEEQRSPLTGHVGERIASERVQLTANPGHRALLIRPFDGEGVPSRPLSLLQNGVVGDLAIARGDEDLDWTVSGYGPRQPSGADAVPTGAVLDAGGHGTVDDLVARTPSARLIARLWYNRLVDGRAARVTGMTRDGFYQLVDGRIDHALVNLRYNVRVFDVLNAIVDASEPVRVGSMYVPALVVDGFHFTGATVHQ